MRKKYESAKYESAICVEAITYLICIVHGYCIVQSRVEEEHVF